MRKRKVRRRALLGLMMAAGLASSRPVHAQVGDASTAQVSAAAKNSSANPRSLASVYRVGVGSSADGAAFVDVWTTNLTHYHTLKLTSPSRLVLDIETARIDHLKTLYPATSLVLKDARVGQFTDTVVRVVADLAQEAIADVYPEPGGLRIAVRGPGPDNGNLGSAVRGSEKLAARVESPPPHATVAKHSNSEPGTLPHPLMPGDQKAKLRAPKLASSQHDRATEPSPSRAPSGLSIAILPVALNGSPDAPWLRTAAGSESAPPQPSPIKTPVTNRPAASLAVGAGTGISGSTAPTPPGAPAPAKPQYTGERISVNLKDVDLTDFFRLIHEVSGLNVIVDPNVSGKLTLVLDSVPWDQALDIVLKNNGLGKMLEGNVLRIAKLTTLEQEEGASARLEQARLDAGPLVTVVRRLKYARAADIQAAQSTIPGIPPQLPTPGVVTILKSLAGVLSKRGEVMADTRNNAVIITDVQSQIPIIESVVDKLDTRPKQISIEAKIVAANSDFVRTLGVQLGNLLLNKSGSVMTGAATGNGATVTATPPSNTSTTSSGTTGNSGTTKTSTASSSGTIPPAVTIGSTIASGFGAFAISSASAHYLINAAIDAAETRDQLKLISSPTIITQNNVLGKVAQGIEVPYQTTINNTISTQFKDATLELDVTPQVTADGNIFLQLYVQDDTVGPVVPGIGASINHQSATTQVLIPDGGTVVFGGIKLTRRANTTNQVPGLGSLPLVGNLFKSREVDQNDQELLFIITPKVLPDELAGVVTKP
ncbi:MAG TPA: type IV pilus secretin PilQ [Terriglobia bacterium]|nr:type IV pilus secretin PilQ [Terriglobia bacterium]